MWEVESVERVEVTPRVPGSDPAPVERKRGERDQEEEDGIDSFLPAYVYDAMKEKKRFANMIVSYIQNICNSSCAHSRSVYSGRLPGRC